MRRDTDAHEERELLLTSTSDNRVSEWEVSARAQEEEKHGHRRLKETGAAEFGDVTC